MIRHSGFKSSVALHGVWVINYLRVLRPRQQERERGMKTKEKEINNHRHSDELLNKYEPIQVGLGGESNQFLGGSITDG